MASVFAYFICVYSFLQVNWYTCSSGKKHLILGDWISRVSILENTIFVPKPCTFTRTLECKFKL